MTTAEGATAQENNEIYGDFDAFLKAAIYEYYQQSGKKNKASFIALVMASGEVMSLALDTLKSESGLRRIALGAAGVAAVRVGLRYALAGPLGVLLAGAAVASLLAYFIKNRGEITGKIGPYRELVANVRVGYEKLQSDHRDGRLDAEQRNLMIDGLLKRFLADVAA